MELRKVAVVVFALAAWLSIAAQSTAQEWTSPSGCPVGEMLVFDVSADPGVYDCIPEDQAVLDQFAGACTGEYEIAVPVSSQYGWSADPICYPLYEEGLNGGWYDIFGNLVPSQGECPEGYFVWESPANGLDHATCSEESEEVSGPVEVPDEAPDPSDKEIVPIIGPAYVVGTNGDGLVCRDAPDGAPVTTLPEGTWVNRLEVYVEAGDWQRVAYQGGDSSPDCYVWADYLTSEPKDSDVYESGVDTGSTDPQTVVNPVEDDPGLTVTESPVNGPVETVTPVVTGLPSTGDGMSPESQKDMVIGISIIASIALGIGLFIKWSNNQLIN